MFSFIKSALQGIFGRVTSAFDALFGRSRIDDAAVAELERILYTADTGVAMTRSIIEQVSRASQTKALSGNELKQLLATILRAELGNVSYNEPTESPQVFMLVGINGAGKTSFAAKLAYRLQQQGKKILFAAADTFRAAAVDQLRVWADRLGIACVTGTSSDPGSVVFQALDTFKKGAYNVLIIDTAGRLQTKVNLMKELEKLRNIVGKQLPNTPVITLLTIDAMLGQNSLAQADVFSQAAPIDGVVLTKMDGTSKGGIVFAIAHQLRIPVAYITYGENLADCALFEPDSYVNQLLGENT